MNKNKRIKQGTSIFILSILLSVLFSLLFINIVSADTLESSNFKLVDYGFGAGGSSNSASLNFGLFGTIGEVSVGSPSSSLFRLGAGLEFTGIALTLPAPTLSNPATNYDRLKIIINGVTGLPSDIKYAVAISSDGFVNDIRYIKSDKTPGNTLASVDFQDYTTFWGGASGTFVSGLNNSTNYSIRVKAKQGNFSDGFWSPVSATVATSDPSLTFGLNTSSIAFDNLNVANSFTDASKETVLTTSTNAYSGYVAFAKETQILTSANGTISDYGSPNSDPTSWTGTGFGYSTTDNDLQTGPGTNTRFNSGNNYAGFTTTQLDPVADHTDNIENPALSDEQFTVKYKVVVSSDTSAGKYSNTIIYTIVPIY